MADVTDIVFGSGFMSPPEHTCPPGNSEPSPQCPGCAHAMNRFAELFYPFLDLVRESGDDPGATDLPLRVFELRFLGLTPTLWIHCACIATQLASKPLTIDRTAAPLAELLAADPGYGAPTLDKIDAMLMHAGLLNLDAANDAAVELLETLGEEGEWLAHLLLASMARYYIDTELGLWQQTIHRSLYGDMMQAIGYPSELLMAARISGLTLEGDSDAYHQLISRSVRDRTASLLLRIWNHASAKYHENLRYSIVRTDEHGTMDALVNPDGDIADAENEIEKGFMLAARMVKAVADGDRQLSLAVKLELQKDPDVVPCVIHSCAYFHAQVMHALYRDRIAAQRECCSHHATSDASPDTGTSAHDVSGIRRFDPYPFDLN